MPSTPAAPRPLPPTVAPASPAQPPDRPAPRAWLVDGTPMAVLERATTRVSSGFHMLQNMAPDQIAPFISHEHPQTIALILSQLESAQAWGILARLPKRMQADVAYRVATMESITPSILRSPR